MSVRVVTSLAVRQRMWLMMMIISMIIMMIRIVVKGGLGSEPSDQLLFGFINNLSLGRTLRDLCVTFHIKATKKTISVKKKKMACCLNTYPQQLLRC